MAFFKSATFKAMLNPILTRAAANNPHVASMLESSGFKASRPMTGAKGDDKGDDVGALLKFLLINVASVIGAKLLSEATDYATTKLAQRQQATMESKVEPAVKKGKKPAEMPTLETRTCPKCGAFRVRGELCTCA